MQFSKPQLTLILSLFALTVLILTNPSEETHKTAVKAKMNVVMQRILQEQADPKSGTDGLVQGLGLAFGGSMLDGIVNSTVSRTNFVLFSTTNISSGDKSRTIGLGVLGNVFLSSKVDKTLSEITTK